MENSPLIAALVLTLPLAGSLFATTIHVPADQPTIQAGIGAAADGDSVVVAPGTYHEHDIDFLGKAIRVTGEDPDDSLTVATTVVTADSLGSVFVFDSGETAGSVLTGLTITGGVNTPDGGGIYCFQTSPRILKNVITGNRASMVYGQGGGIWSGQGSPTISGNVITNNRAGSGGGIRCGGDTLVVSGNRIERNEAAGQIYGGGGILFYRVQSGTITQNLISSNSTVYDGAGLTLNALGGEGIIYLSGNTVTGNQADAAGKADGLSVVGPDVIAENNIFWGDGEIEITVSSEYVAVTYSDVQGGWLGEGNIDADPLFFDPSAGDFRLRQDPPQPGVDNPCVDSGNPSSLIPVGTTRTDAVVDGWPIDMGYHYPWDGVTNLPPYALFEFTPAEPRINQAVDFDASNSYDLDGTIVTYEWDWESDGIYDDSSGDPFATHTWSVPDSLAVTLRATDDLGARGIRAVGLIVHDIGEPPGYAVLREWVATYDSPDQSTDRGNSISLDPFGNVIVAGSSLVNLLTGEKTCTTVKYDRHGREQWVARDGDYLECSCSASAVDDSGNVYVTGYDWAGGDFWDQGRWPLIKYSPSGDLRWFHQAPVIPFAFSGPEGANDIALDDTDNVYATGVGYPGNYEPDDAYTVKYSPGGDLLWLKQYHGTYTDRANAIAIDSMGGCTVVGGTQGTSSGMNFLTISYGADGSQQAVRTYDGPAGGDDEALDVAMAPQGFTCVTGKSPGVDTGLDYATIRYDSMGNEVWVARYDGSGSGNDVANALVVDGAGNVYVTGSSPDSSGTNDFTTIKYSPSGDELWVARYDGPAGWDDAANAIALDPDMNVIVAGSVTVRGADQTLHLVHGTVAYRGSDGQEIWSVLYGPEGGDNEVYDLAVDAAGNAYVTGEEQAPGMSENISTEKFRPLRLGLDPYPADSVRAKAIP